MRVFDYWASGLVEDSLDFLACAKATKIATTISTIPVEYVNFISYSFTQIYSTIQCIPSF